MINKKYNKTNTHKLIINVLLFMRVCIIKRSQERKESCLREQIANSETAGPGDQRGLLTPLRFCRVTRML